MLTEFVKVMLDDISYDRFVTMTGAKNFVGQGDGVSFDIPKTKNKINKVKIEKLEGGKVLMKFFNYMPTRFKLDKREERIVPYADIIKTFEEVTGIKASL